MSHDPGTNVPDPDRSSYSARLDEISQQAERLQTLTEGLAGDLHSGACSLEQLPDKVKHLQGIARALSASVARLSERLALEEHGEE